MRTKDSITTLRMGVERLVKTALKSGASSTDVLDAVGKGIDSAAKVALPVQATRPGWILFDSRMNRWLDENSGWTPMPSMAKIFHTERDAQLRALHFVGVKPLRVDCVGAGYRDESLCKHPEFSNHIAGGE